MTDQNKTFANRNLNSQLRQLPQTDEVLKHACLKTMEPLLPHEVLSRCAREAIDQKRQAILNGDATSVNLDVIAEEAQRLCLLFLRPSLRRVINATGIIIHTNLGRSPLAPQAIDAISEVAGHYSTLEYDTTKLTRGSRHDHLESLICILTGAEAALAVNNNASAVLLVLMEFAKGKKAIISRGELVEIGGSFRIPDIMELSGVNMVEIGTTNKTHLDDYRNAIDDDVAMLLKVHPSNYRMIGFTESVSIETLKSLTDSINQTRKDAHPRNDQSDTPPVSPLLVYEDQGSGAFLRLDCFGVYSEPTVTESIKEGCDLVSFSGDKLLGGAQAGIIVGRRELIQRLKKNPLVRAIRLDKMTIAALEATLRLYLDPHRTLKEIPTLRMLSEPIESVERRANNLALAIENVLRDHCHPVPPEEQVDGIPRSKNIKFYKLCAIRVVSLIAHSGGGALPACNIDSAGVEITFEKGTAQDCEHYLANRNGIPVIGYIKHGALLFDTRTICNEEIPLIAEAVSAYFRKVDIGETYDDENPQPDPPSLILSEGSFMKLDFTNAV